MQLFLTFNRRLRARAHPARGRQQDRTRPEGRLENKPGDTKPNKPSQNDNKNNDKNGASLSATGSSVIAIVAAMVVLLGAGAVVLRARSKTE